jgi:hypothetical protein
MYYSGMVCYISSSIYFRQHCCCVDTLYVNYLLHISPIVRYVRSLLAALFTPYIDQCLYWGYFVLSVHIFNNLKMLIL